MKKINKSDCQQKREYIGTITIYNA